VRLPFLAPLGASVHVWTVRDAMLMRIEPAAGPGDPASLPRVPSIAVLPFADMSPDRSQGFLAEGIAEELIHALTRGRSRAREAPILCPPVAVPNRSGRRRTTSCSIGTSSTESRI
jgi:hypothetical protein